MATKKDAPAMSWDDFGDFETGVYTREGPTVRRVDIVAEVPAVIREQLEKLYRQFDQDVTLPNGKVVKAGKPKYLDWNAGSPERATEFARLARRYGQYRPEGQITVRTTVFDGTWVHFTAKPMETRTRAAA